VPEQRVRVTPTRYRVPDIAVLDRKPDGGVVMHPPVLVIEVLSPCDRLQDLQARMDDYFSMGVPAAWVIDPVAKRAWQWTPDGWREAKDGVLRAAPQIELSLAGLFAAADQ
jgi:Uma2 family endonuclease